MREIDVLSQQAWDSRIMRESWQVYRSSVQLGKTKFINVAGALIIKVK